jgi:hypothetical protein
MRTRSSASAGPAIGPKFSEEFQNFAPYAWWTYKPGTDMKTWARQHASRFWHTVSKETAFVVVYNAFLSFGAESLKRDPKGSIVYQHRQKLALERDARLVDAIVPDGKQTAAEERLAKNQLNRILFAEYEKWWDAFQQEGEENPDAEMNGTLGFMRHCAKILYRRTGLRDDVLESVVGAWLLQHHGLCASRLEPEGDAWIVHSH